VGGGIINSFNVSLTVIIAYHHRCSFHADQVSGCPNSNTGGRHQDIPTPMSQTAVRRLRRHSRRHPGWPRPSVRSSLWLFYGGLTLLQSRRRLVFNCLSCPICVRRCLANMLQSESDVVIATTTARMYKHIGTTRATAKLKLRPPNLSEKLSVYPYPAVVTSSPLCSMFLIWLGLRGSKSE